MRTVLLPVDGSQHAFAATQYLIDFSRQHGPITVHVLNVEPAPIEWQTHAMEADAIHDRLTVRAHIAMKSVLNALNEAGVAHYTHIEQGDTAEIIAAQANKLACDTIVMGTRGLGGLAALALGSVTRKVLHLATVPVICVKASAN